MLAVNYSTVCGDLTSYCDRAEEEMILVTRKPKKDIVLMSLENYNQLAKAARNAEYLAMIDEGIEQLAAGRGQQHELIELDDE